MRHQIEAMMHKTTQVWLFWGITRLALLLNLILTAHYCDPQFYQYAGDFAVGRLPYRDVAVEYPPLALVMMIVPALPLLPFAGIAPRPEADPHPLHPNPVRYGAYGISFAVMMVLLDALTLWLVQRTARRLAPGDASGTWSMLLYIVLTLLIGGVIQKFDLAVGMLCLVAITELVARRDGLAWAALAAATLLKGFPLALAPLFILYRLSTLNSSRSSNPLSAFVSRLDPWRRAILGGGAVSLAVLVPTLALGGIGALVQSVAYHASRGIEIESVPASVMLALGWLPGLHITTLFDHADLSRDVVGALAGPLGALATPLMVIMFLVIYGLFWYTVLRRGPTGRVGRDQSHPYTDGGQTFPANTGEHAFPANTGEHAFLSVAHRARAQILMGAACALLLAFMVSFRAMPIHYLLALAPLAVVVRLPAPWQRWWLAALMAAGVAGQIVLMGWHSLVTLAPGIVAVQIARNVAVVAALAICIYAALWATVSRKKEAINDIRAVPTTADHHGELRTAG
jgi:hypothetical protein